MDLRWKLHQTLYFLRASVSRALGRFLRTSGLAPGLRDAFERVERAVVGDTKPIRIAGSVVSFKRLDEGVTFTDYTQKERRVIKDILATCTPETTFFDIGANYGMYTCLVADVAGSDNVVAFEPHAGNTTLIRENLSINDLQATVVHAAVGDSDGTVDFALQTETAGATHNMALPDGPAATTSTMDTVVEVEMTTLDSYVEEESCPVPEIVKIDVEGAEYGVIDGARETLEHDDCRLVYCEVHPRHLPDYGHDADAVESALVDLGFEVEVVHKERQQDKSDEAYFLRAIKP
ncbi:FkbM family methyltransferase [Haloarcula sp. JP-L23]|uniref:FkbM family methyltransferase n=1 Tax=Haloarcula sp. JP-L23 TaxID=2716717 RepID=UPI00140EC9AF|nr:FkbM family methyltransferase [Haloarcula sp. JP-L23]